MDASVGCVALLGGFRQEGVVRMAAMQNNALWKPRASYTCDAYTQTTNPWRLPMASPAWLAGFMAAFGQTRRYHELFSLSDRQLAVRGYDRAGLQRSYIAALGGF